MAKTLIQAISKASGWSESGAGLEVPLEGGRSQSVTFETFEEHGETFIRLVSAIGASERLDDQRMRAALRLNAELRFGAFAIVDQSFAVVDTFLLREAEVDEVRESVAFLASTADRYEQVVFGTDKN